MKKLLYFAFLIAIATTLNSCGGKKVVIDESRTFTNEKWLREDPQTFNLTISNSDDCYNMYVKFRFDTTYLRGNNMPLVVNLYSDNNERRMWYSYIFLKNDYGTWLHDLDGKYLVGEQQIKEYFFFNNKGDYRLEIGHGTDRYELRGIGEFGLRIEKAKLVYPE